MTDVLAPIRKFEEFVDSLQTVGSARYLNVPHSRIADEQAFTEIRTHLTSYYAGVEPVYSFIDANGAIFDCIPVEQQVSLRGKGGRVPEAPELPGHATTKTSRLTSGDIRVTQLHPRLTDPLGNQMLAPEGTIPVRRLTLEDLAGFESLRTFLEKPSALMSGAPLQPQIHQYATAQQTVRSIGAGSILNVWDPQIAAGQLMSLSQIWIAAGQDDNEQTVEAGWQVNPGRYGNSKPVLFTYWTADHYRSTGCYNLTCAGFVQTSNNWMLGGALPFWSSTGGPQWAIQLDYFLFQGRWWLFVEGEAVGYFPKSIFNGGAMATGSTRIVFGGEVATTNNATWPPMGSGSRPAANNWKQVAYQRQIHYFLATSGRKDASLDPLVPAPWCYGATAAKYSRPWKETLWFGGSGGANCAPI